ncbi:MAG: polysaccharide biosynthesis C-terminal domain-containing protein, partial [Chloroflexi bacterium]|nr:polysaccharide biosynthesis C-terminal domain-containing protein [Chloroflexota bacterium]
ALAMQQLAVWGSVWSLGLNLGTLYQAVGKPALGSRHQLVRVDVALALVYPMALKWGMAGAAAGMLMSAVIAFPVGVRQATDALGCPMSAYFKSLVVPALGSMVMAGVLLGSRRMAPDEPTLVVVLVLIAIGGLAYLASLLVLDRMFRTGIGDSVVRTVKAGRATV